MQVMRELKRVEGQSFDIRAAAQQEEYSMGNEQAEEPSNQNPSEVNAPEATEVADEKRKASVGGKKKGVNAGKAAGPVTKTVRPEQKKLADKVGDVKRASSVKVKPVKTAAPDPAASKVKQTLKKAMSVTTPKAKAEVGRTKSLGVKEKKVAPPTAPKPTKTVIKEDDEGDVVADSKTVAETKGLPGHLGDQKSGSQSGGASKSSAVSKPVTSKANAASATIKPSGQVTKEKKGPQVGGSVGPKKEVSEKKDTAGKKRPTAEKAKEAVPLRSKPAMAKAASSPTEARPSGSIRKKVTSTVGGEKSGKGPNIGGGAGPAPDSDIMSQSTGPAAAHAAKRTPPVVPPKPSSPNKSRISPTSQSDSSIPSSPVVGHKSSVAERARLVGALEVTTHIICQCHLSPDQVAEERAPATHFVSSARATLSPLPGRKVFNVPSTQEEKDPDVEKKDEVQESGIVETSIKASSVIKQFETRKISKIKPDEEVFSAAGE